MNKVSSVWDTDSQVSLNWLMWISDKTALSALQMTKVQNNIGSNSERMWHFDFPKDLDLDLKSGKVYWKILFAYI